MSITLRERSVTQVSRYNKTHGLSKHPIYLHWQEMKRRCLNPNTPRYLCYAGRGIYVCEEWRNNFLAFYDWSMLNGYAEGLTVDRKDNDGPYAPWNCRWTSACVQQGNKGISKNNTSGHKGISWIKDRLKWESKISVNGKTVHLGQYDLLSDAIDARKRGEIMYWGELQ